MPTPVTESYTPLPLAINFDGAVSSASCTLAGFTCVISGSLTLRDRAAGSVFVDALPVSAGVYHPLPYSMPNGAYVTLTGGAKGTIAWTS
jgi:hypothetical protein